jgi:hypothetical protein
MSNRRAGLFETRDGVSPIDLSSPGSAHRHRLRQGVQPLPKMLRKLSMKARKATMRCFTAFDIVRASS